MREHVRHTGYYRRTVRALAQRLGVAPTAEAVLEAGRRVGADAARAQLDEAGIEALLVDTGYPPDAMPLAEMRQRLGCAVHEVVRIETCAERLLPRRLPYGDFVEEFRRSLLAAAPGCVAFKTIVAYRSGLDVARGASTRAPPRTRERSPPSPPTAASDSPTSPSSTGSSR